MTPLRLGIVGPGLIWEHAHKPVISRLYEHFLPTAFSARSAETRDKVAEQYPQCSFYTDYRDLVRSEEIDAVVALTPIPMNATVGISALEAGKHVFLEKPIALNTQEALRLIEAEERSGKRVFVLEQVPYDPVWTPMREALGAGEIGQAVCYEKATHVYLEAEDDPRSGYGGTDWRKRPDFPLGLVFDGGIHDLAVLSSFFGQPERVYAQGAKLREEFGEYDQTIMLLGYGNGISGMFSHSGFLGGSRNYFVIRGTEGLLYQDSAQLYLESKQGHRKDLEVEQTSAHERMWQHFVHCLEQDRAPDYNASRSLLEFRVFDAIAESLQGGKAAAVPGA